MILAIEGIDGAGKNTLMRQLAAGVDMPCEVLSFPRYGESLPAQLAARALHQQMGDLTESVYGMATLFALDRKGALDYLEAAATNSNLLLLCDRYVASNAAYSMARLHQEDEPAGEVASWISQLEFGTLGLPHPDLQVLLDTPPHTAAHRARRREAHDRERLRDSYERDAGLQDRTFAAYQNLAAHNWGGPWLVTSGANDILSWLAGR